MKQSILLLGILFFTWQLSSAQCCAGGAGSPVAGGTAQGVLQAGQVELNTNFQLISTDKFFEGDKPTEDKYFDSFRSAYQYFRLAYGLSSKLTMSIESGNYFYKEEIGLDNDLAKTYKSSGIGDLILFPRYTVMKSNSKKHNSELTLGLGFKIPLGSYNDSTGNIEPFSGQTYYVIKPQAVQLSTGAQDIIFYSFYFRGYPDMKARFFVSALYIKKGWNPIGEKLGDFASLGVFAGKTFAYKYGLTLQVRAEWMDQMQLNKDIFLYAPPNYEPKFTGYKKVFFTPQLSYTGRSFTFYTLFDIPIYQNLTKIQVGTMFQATAGISYKFIVRPKIDLP